MKYLISICFTLFPFLIFSQISREFNSSKVNGNFVQFIEKSYDDVKLDENGIPIVPKNADQESIHFLKDGYSVESRFHEIENGKKELSLKITLERKGPIIHLAEIYSYRRGKEHLLRSHIANVKNGRIVSEIIKKNGKEVGKVQYSSGSINQGTNYETINLNNYGRQIKFYTERDNNGVVFSAQINGIDTVMILKRIESQGDSINKSIAINKNLKEESSDSVLIIERTWFDTYHNPIMDLTQMIALTEPPPGQPKTMNYLSTFTYLNDENSIKTTSSVMSSEKLHGAWQNEANNIELFFEPNHNGKQRLFGSSYLLKSNEPTIEQYQYNKSLWIFMLKQDYKPSIWKLNNDKTLTITLSNGSILTFLAVLDNSTLILKPKMKNMERELRLNYSN